MQVSVYWPVTLLRNLQPHKCLHLTHITLKEAQINTHPDKFVSYKQDLGSTYESSGNETTNRKQLAFGSMHKQCNIVAINARQNAVSF